MHREKDRAITLAANRIFRNVKELLMNSRVGCTETRDFLFPWEDPDSSRSSKEITGGAFARFSRGGSWTFTIDGCFRHQEGNS